MADFPNGDPLALKGEIYLNGAWTDITSYIRQDDQEGGFVSIERGTPDEATGSKPSECKFQLNNYDGRFSPRNPTGPYYGYLTRNNPVRFSIRTGERTFQMGRGVAISTPDAAAIDITGDLDLRYEATLRTWAVASQILLTKGMQNAVGQYSYDFEIKADGKLRLFWSTTGSDFPVADSTVALPFPWTGRKAVRVTLDVDNGAGGKTVTFYYSSDGTLSGSWVQLGDPVTTAGTTSVFNSTSALVVYNPGGHVHAAQVRNGIAGTVVANPSATSLAEGVTSWADSAGRTWTATDATVVTNRRQRFIGELADLPVSWEPSGADVWTDITAAGILRRLGQGTSEVGSTYRRGLLKSTNVPVAYWPMEDQDGSTSLASPLGGRPGTWTGTPQLASYDGFQASDPIVTLGDSLITLQPTTPAPNIPTSMQVRFFMFVPAAGSTDQAILLQFTSGDQLWQLVYGTGGGMEFKFSIAGTAIATTGMVGMNVNGRKLLVSLELTQSGTTVNFTMATLEVGATSGGTGTGSGSAITGPIRTIAINPNRTHTTVSIGQVSIQPAVDSLFALSDQLRAYDGEMAAVRIKRLCTEEGIPYQAYGSSQADSVAMGAQLPGSLLGLIQDCVEADGGWLIEPRDADLPALGYVGRSALHRVSPLTVSYTSPSGLKELEPRDDDQQLRNDVTVTRVNGSSYRAVRDTGTLSVATVGRYDDSLDLNLQTDDQLPDAANWRLHRGSGVDAPRWPKLCFDLSRAGETSSSLLANLVALDIGSRVQVSNLPSFYSPDSADVLLAQLVETLGPNVWDLDLTTIPALPFDVATYDVTDSLNESRYSGQGTTSTGGTHSPTTTTLFVEWTAVGTSFKGWGHDDGDYQILVAGEVMTVTAVSVVTGLTQQLTVVRSVNGVVKTIPANSQVDLYKPAYYAI